MDGRRWINVPLVVDGKLLTESEAIRLEKSKKNMTTHATPQEAAVGHLSFDNAAPETIEAVKKRPVKRILRSR